ncbi:hypothetical protein F4775DRAFT_531244 [Biscogniauxia sp. FL1348]|nr:hypothetical protein F4775DRAFT_531244 [Biscogniauxia sp. FL1348]
MCISHRYEQVLPDGHVDRWAENDLCHKSRHNKLCDYTQVLQHPAEPYHPDQLSSSYGRMQFPPTPPMSSHSASTSDSERSTKRRSGSYTLDQKVLEINNSKRSSRREKEDRTYIDRTPISRTPPRQFTLPDSVHSSPDRASHQSHESRRRESNVSERDRPTTIKIEIAGSDRPQKTHRRSDASSRTSKASSRDSSDDGSERRRRRQSVAFVETDQELQRKLQLESEIARANAAIANRPVPPTPNAPVPSTAPAPASKPAPTTKTSSTTKPSTASKPTPTSKPAPISAPAPASGPMIKPARLSAPAPVSVPPPSSTTSSARYRRGSVVVDPLVTKMNNLQLDTQYDRRRERLKQAEEQAAREEEEAQKRRLMERMAPRTAEPKRRATVGAAQRRHKVQYDDGLYRFE